jgi:hypothetical protein
MIDHSQCTHPRTPAGRAACRKLRDEIKAEHGAGTDQRANFEAAVAYDKARTRRTRTEPTPNRRSARTRVLRGPGDLADVPHAFGSVIRLAWERDWDVRTGDVYNDNERNIKITSDHGTAIFTWRVSVPFGIHAVAWRSKGTSVTSRCGTVNDAIRLLENDRPNR